MHSFVTIKVLDGPPIRYISNHISPYLVFGALPLAIQIAVSEERFRISRNARRQEVSCLANVYDAGGVQIEENHSLYL